MPASEEAGSSLCFVQSVAAKMFTSQNLSKANNATNVNDAADNLYPQDTTANPNRKTNSQYYYT
jgi:hypothetical protein